MNCDGIKIECYEREMKTKERHMHFGDYEFRMYGLPVIRKNLSHYCNEWNNFTFDESSIFFQLKSHAFFTFCEH